MYYNSYYNTFNMMKMNMHITLQNKSNFSETFSIQASSPTLCHQRNTEILCRGICAWVFLYSTPSSDSLTAASLPL